MKNIKKLVMLGGLAALVYACGRPEYPTPQVNQASIAPLPRTTANNARLMVFNGLADLSPSDDNTMSRLRVVIDGEEMENFDGSPAFVWSRQFRLNDAGVVTPLPRKYPMPASNTNIGVIIPPATTPSPLTSQYLPAASSGFMASQTAFTNFAPFVPASIINGVEVTPAQQERGIFISAGRRDIQMFDRNRQSVSTFRWLANLTPGSLNTMILSGKAGTKAGTEAEVFTTITETLPTANGTATTSPNARVRFLHFASDLGEVQLLTAGNLSDPPAAFRPFLRFPQFNTDQTRTEIPQGTRFRADFANPAAADTLRAIRDSIASRRTYRGLTRNVGAASIPLSAGIIETFDGRQVPNYTWALNFTGNNTTAYQTVPTGTGGVNVVLNVFQVNRRTTAGRILPSNVQFNLLPGGIYTIILHGSAQTGYKLDLIRMN